jgi:hypothetical protein
MTNCRPCGLIVDRHPDVARIGRETALRLRGADLMERQNEMIGTDVPLIGAERSDPNVLIAVIGDVDDEVGRLGAHIGVDGLMPPRFARSLKSRCMIGACEVSRPPSRGPAANCIPE